MLIGTEGVYSYTFEHEKRDDCPVCGGESLELTINPEKTVEEFIEMLIERQDMYVSGLLIPRRNSPPPSQIKKPSLSTPTSQIYFQAPPQLEEATRPNLSKKVSDLVPAGGEMTVTASTLPFNLSLRISYT